MPATDLARCGQGPHQGHGGCGKALVNPCIDASLPYAKQLWCDSTKPIEARAKDAVSRLSLQEKVCSLDTGGCDNPSLGLPDYNWWSEASSGVANNAHAATKFAYPITTAMSFNKSMWHAVGHAIGHEARALMNAGLAQSTFWAPVVNLVRASPELAAPGARFSLKSMVTMWKACCPNFNTCVLA